MGGPDPHRDQPFPRLVADAMITRLEPAGNLRFFDLMGLPHAPVHLLAEPGLLVATGDAQLHLLTEVTHQSETKDQETDTKPETTNRKPQDRHDLTVRLTELISARLTRRTS